MTISVAKRRNNDKYNAKCMQIAIRPLKEDGEMIRAAAAASGLSLQKYIVAACRERMERDSAAVAADEAVSSAGAAQECGAVSIPSDAMEAVRTAAEAAGMTVDAWIVQAIKDKL